MPLVQLIILLLIAGFIVYAIYRWAPLTPGWKQFISIVIGVAVCLYLLSLFGLLPNFNSITVGQ